MNKCAVFAARLSLPPPLATSTHDVLANLLAMKRGNNEVGGWIPFGGWFLEITREGFGVGVCAWVYLLLI